MPRRKRNISVTPKRRREPNLDRLSRAYMATLLQEAAAEAAAQADHANKTLRKTRGRS